MAFALALQAVHDLENGDGEIIFTATTAIVVLTVLLIGGTTSTMLEKLEVVGEGPRNSSDLDGDEDEMQGLRTHDDTENGEMSSVDSITAKFQDLRRSTATFTAIDQNYLRPFFTNEDKHRNSTDRAPNGGAS